MEICLFPKRLAIQRTSTFDIGKVTSDVNLQIDCFYPMSLSNRSEWICSCVKLAVQDLANHWSLKMFCLLALPLSLLVCWRAESRVDWIWTKKWQDDATCSRQRVSVFGNGLQQIIRLVCIFALEHCQCGGGKHGEKQEEWWLNQSQVQILTPQPSVSTLLQWLANRHHSTTSQRHCSHLIHSSVYSVKDNFWLTKTNCYIICRILRVTHKTKYQWLELEFRHLILFSRAIIHANSLKMATLLSTFWSLNNGTEVIVNSLKTTLKRMRQMAWLWGFNGIAKGVFTLKHTTRILHFKHWCSRIAASRWWFYK